jgi:hypothetical protein
VAIACDPGGNLDPVSRLSSGELAQESKGKKQATARATATATSMTHRNETGAGTAIQSRRAAVHP